MKKVLKICSVSVLAILACSVIFIKFRKKDPHSSKSAEMGNKKKSYPSDVDKNIIPTSELDVSREETLSTLKERHDEAADIIKESVENILKKTEIQDDEVSELDSLSDELDELLNEEDE